MPHTISHTPEFLMTYLRDRELNELYVSVFLKTLAQSLITVFIPVYLVILGFTIFDVSLYYLIYFMIFAAVMPFAMLLHSRFGIKKTLALGTFILIFYYYLLGSLESGSSYYLIAVVFGISSAVYYSAFHVEFAKFTKKGKEASEFSVLMIVAILAGVLGPLMGSLIITEISFIFLFKLVAVILFISIIPLFYTKDFTIPFEKYSIKGIVESDTKEKAIGYWIAGILVIVSLYFWPLFIYLTLNNVVSLGIIVSFTSLLTVLIIAYIGRLTDKDKKSVLKVGVILHAPSWLFRIFLLSPVGIFFINFYGSITSCMIDIPFNKMVYSRAKKSKNILNYFLFREFNLMIGRVAILAFVMFVQSFVWMFVICFFATFVYLVLLREK